jgi:hypothetical protein
LVPAASRFTWRSDGSASLHIEAPPECVYDHIADVTRTGARSLETRVAEWLPGSSAGSVGARFRGRNRSGLARWSRICEVLEADRGRRFAFRTVPQRFDPTRADSTIWGYAMHREGAGTRLTHDYHVVRLPLPGFRHLYSLLLPHHRDMRPHLEYTLRALKADLENGGPDAARGNPSAR